MTNSKSYNNGANYCNKAQSLKCTHVPMCIGVLQSRGRGQRGEIVDGVQHPDSLVDESVHPARSLVEQAASLCLLGQQCFVVGPGEILRDVHPQELGAPQPLHCSGGC